MLATNYLILDEGVIVKNLTIEELNEECKSYIVIETENIEHAKKVLDGLGYSGYYTQINKNKINILDMNVDMRSLAESFFKAGIILTEFSRFNKSLEKYFLEIAGGQKNDQYA
jgi:ABC-2 type transport system ATP-binding protein